MLVIPFATVRALYRPVLPEAAIGLERLRLLFTLWIVLAGAGFFLF